MSLGCHRSLCEACFVFLPHSQYFGQDVEGGGVFVNRSPSLGKAVILGCRVMCCHEIILTENVLLQAHDKCHKHKGTHSKRLSDIGKSRHGIPWHRGTRDHPLPWLDTIPRCGKGCCSSYRIWILLLLEVCLKY